MATQNIAAGLLMCDKQDGQIRFLLVHPGGPFFKNKQDGAWTIPKGVPLSPTEELLSAAIREFTEETGLQAEGPYESIGYIKQKAGKVIHAWTFLGQWDPSTGIISNTFTIEWPPKSGKSQAFPEVDEGRWMDYAEAINKINPAQIPFLDRAKAIWN